MTPPLVYHELQSVSYDHYREEAMRVQEYPDEDESEVGKKSPPGSHVKTRSMRSDVNRVFKTSRSRAPREMTLKRKGKIEKFFIHIASNPRKCKYGEIGSKLWIKELISFMNEPRNHKILPSDVTFWIRTTPQFFEKSLRAAMKQKRPNGSVSSSSSTPSSPQSEDSSKTSQSDSGTGSAGDSYGAAGVNGGGGGSKENQAPLESMVTNMEEESTRSWYPQHDFLSKTPPDMNVTAGPSHQSLLTEVKREEDEHSSYYCYLDPLENMMMKTFMSPLPPTNVLLQDIKLEPIPTTSQQSASAQQIPLAPNGFVLVNPNHPGTDLVSYGAQMPKPVFNFFVTPEKPMDDPNLTYTLTAVPADLANFIMNVDYVGDVAAGLPRWVETGVIPPNLQSVQLLTNMLGSLLDKVRAAGGPPKHTVDGLFHATRCMEAFLAHNLPQ